MAIAAKSLRAFNALLVNVSEIQYDCRHVPQVQYTRLNQHDQPAVELARLILSRGTIELGHGERVPRSTAFLVDMNQVFESLIVVAVREKLGIGEKQFPKNSKGRRIYLDDARKIRLEPDISWWDGKSCSWVGDVKDKRIKAAGKMSTDLYQLLSYTIATDLPRGLLIYAAGACLAFRGSCWQTASGNIT